MTEEQDVPTLPDNEKPARAGESPAPPVNRPSEPAPAITAPGGLVERVLLLDPNEPAFVLRAGDLLAPEFVLKWAAEAETYGVDKDRVRAARRCARDMNDWRLKKGFRK